MEDATLEMPGDVDDLGDVVVVLEEGSPAAELLVPPREMTSEEEGKAVPLLTIEH